MNKKACTVGLFAILLANFVSAAIVIPPPDLSPGDQYRLVFVTSGTTTANSNDISSYNNFVNAQAASVSATGFPTSGWTAIVSTTTVDARDNTGTASGTGVPIYRVDGLRIADDYTDLWNGGTLQNDLSVTQQGDLYPSNATLCGFGPARPCAWTGTSSLGTAASPLGDASSLSSSALGDIFQLDTVNTNSWILYYFFTRAANAYPLYAMSAVLTVPDSSGPATYTVGGSVSGLTGSVTLQNNGADNLVRSTDGAFTFATALADGASYSVTVLTQPSGQNCSVSNGAGTIGGGNVTTVQVNCVDAPPPPAPPPPSTSGRPIPTLSAYGLAVTMLGVLVVAGRRLRRSDKKR